ncbi:MAG: M20/M25/M40 family metallo-hydrolase [Bdellovibrionota bacterium]
MKSSLTTIFMSVIFSSTVFAAPAAKSFILSDKELLDEANIKPLYIDEATGIAMAKISSLQQTILLRKSHEKGRCGGFELLSDDATQKDLDHAVSLINARRAIDNKEMKKGFRALEARSSVSEAIADVSEAKIKEWVDWLSSFESRYHKGPTPNKHVEALQAKLDEELKAYPELGATTSLVSHVKTTQKTLRLTIPGKSKADEIVGMGAHLDSITSSFIGFPTGGRSPGSDDDASGSASILEALRHILKQAPYERTLEFYWYAGEEAGLLGSAELAQSYKSEGRKMAGVLQLDMTLYPGSGSGNIASINDYTSPEMRAMLLEFNRLYLGVNIIDDKCGYACSDHASWYKNGYPTLMPTEATFHQMNKKIHSKDDVVNSSSSFEHAAIFSKIAIAFASHLGNP